MTSNLKFPTSAWILKTQIVKKLRVLFFFCFWPDDNFEAENKNKYIFLQSNIHKNLMIGKEVPHVRNLFGL